GSKIHIIGICGTAMGQLACLLQDRGFVVSGSDREFYEPMASVLRSRDFTLHQGYSEDNIRSDLDLVVIGNSVPRDNAEVVQTESLGLAYSCFPQALYELMISGKHSVVVTGTHGKSTTSALMAYCLDQVGLKPSYF